MDHKAKEHTNNTEDQQQKKEYIQKVISQINLSGLTQQQKEAVTKMLQEKAEPFSVLDTNVGNVKDPTMKIHLSDDTPI